WAAGRLVSPIPRRIALALALAPWLFTGRATLTGGIYAPIDILYEAHPYAALRPELGSPVQAPALTDVVYLEIPWREAARRALLEGRLPLWNPSVLAGEPLHAVQQAGIHQPSTWIGLLLPSPQAWTFEMSFRILLALLCAYLFFRDLGCADWAAVLGGLGWAFCDYLDFFLGYPQSAAAAPFPLLLLGVRRLVRAPGRRSVAIAVVGFLLIATAGHPETLLHAMAPAGAYFLFELAGAPRGRRLRGVGAAAAAGAFALGLSAVQLLPLAEALPHTAEHPARKAWYAHQPRAERAGESLFRLVPQVVPYAVGVAGHGNQIPTHESTAYAGALLFPFAMTGLFARGRDRWFFVLLGLAGLAVATRTFAAQAIAWLPLFDIALNDRIVFWASFAVCALAALGANRLADGEGAPAFLVGAVLSMLLVWGLHVHYRRSLEILGMPAEYRRLRFNLQIVPLAAGAALVAALSRRRLARGGLLALVALFAAERTLEAGSFYPTYSSRFFYPHLPVLERIPRGEPYRMTALAYTFIPNAAGTLGLEDVRGYEAMTLQPFYDTFPLWCVPQPVWYNRIDDPTRPFLSFLNVRWVLQPLDQATPPGWAVLAEGDGVRLLENPRTLPRAFVPRRIRAEPDRIRRLDLLRAIADFGEDGVVDESGPDSWRENGGGRVHIAAYGPQAIALDVEADGETVVGTSIPAWPGWKSTLDGRAIPSLSYNHAFVGVRVPGGRHRVELRYFPDSVFWGLGISGTTLALAAAGAVLLRRRRASAR
ncbi:MAG TPA: YfhO family protein, partial [Thermoanaerobaculia bacterium]